MLADTWLVPHRTDIGVGLWWAIALCVLVALGRLPGSLAPCGELHILVLAPQQLNFLLSVVRRGDLPPKRPHRLCALLLVYAGLAYAHMHSMARLSVALNAASLWAVKLKLRGAAEKAA